MFQQVKPPVSKKRESRTPDGFFRPSQRGSIAKALAEPNGVAVIAPEFPRPAEMLEHVEIRQVDGFRLTVDDEILHDLMASQAYEADRAMPDAMHTLKVSDAVRYLNSKVADPEKAPGPDEDKKPGGKKRRPGGIDRDDVLASLRRLKTATVSYGAAGGRRYSDVSLIEWWCETTADESVIRYRLPAPIRELLGTQPRFGYIEMAALPTMSSKYSLRLYKRLALEAARSEKKWAAGADNTIRLSPTPEEFARWIDFPVDATGGVKAGKLRERVLDKLAADFRGARKFALTVSPRKGSGRGAPMEAIDIEIVLRAPDRRVVRSFFKPSFDSLRPGHKDVEKYCLESRTVRRANTTFGRAMLMTHGREFADLWQVALHEALSGEPITEGYASRPTRGQRLLETVEVMGADYAAWALFEQECEDPDLRLARKADFRGYLSLQEKADQARYDRLGDEAPRGTRKKAPIYLRDDALDAPAPAPSRSVSTKTFDHCDTVVIRLDPAVGGHELDGIGTAIRKCPAWHGDRSIGLSLIYGDSEERWDVGRFKVSEDDLDAILKRFERMIDGPEEYE